MKALVLFWVTAALVFFSVVLIGPQWLNSGHAGEGYERRETVEAWEYYVLYYPRPTSSSTLQDKLNECGKVGYELVSADGTSYFFKRKYHVVKVVPPPQLFICPVPIAPVAEQKKKP